jgi:hypothetical protein
MIKVIIDEKGDAGPFWACDVCNEVREIEWLNIIYPKIWKEGETTVARVMCKGCSEGGASTQTHWTGFRTALEQMEHNNRLATKVWPEARVEQ